MKPNDFSFAKSRRFAPLFGTQFQGALNDNLFKTALFVMISYHGLGKNSILPPAQMLNLGALLFILPYFLFSSISGQLSTRYDKARFARIINILEIVIMGVAAYGFYIQSSVLLLAMLFCMGAQSTLFGPLKYAILPDYLEEGELMMGNSLIESGTFIAILFGQIIGTVVAGAPHWVVMTLVILIAVGGTLTSFFMPYVGAKNPHQPIDLNIFRSTKQLLKDTFAQRELYTAIIGISWFWLIGAVYTTQLPTFTQKHLGGNDNVFNLMLALFSIGIAAGSILCSKLSLLVWLTHGNHYQAGQFQGIFGFLSNGYAYPVMACMIAIGFFGGFFSVPLYTWLQTASSDEFRANAIAANNIINGLFMVAAAIISAVLLFLSDSITLLYLAVAVGNPFLLTYLIRLDKRFIRRAP